MAVPFDIQNIFLAGEAHGVFTFLLPGLLIFAVVYGILTGTKTLGENKGVHAVVAIIVAAMALRLGILQDFFTVIFPRAGIAIAVILVLVILTSLFTPEGDEGKGIKWVLYGVAALSFIFVVFSSFSAVNWFGSNWWNEWGGWFIFIIAFAGIIVAVILPGKKDKDK